MEAYKSVKITDKKKIYPGYVGVWKTGEHTGVVHAYGFSPISQYFKSKEDIVEQFNSDNIEPKILKILREAVAADLTRKIKIMMNEDYLPQHEVFNYGRFFDRYITRCNVPSFSDAKLVSKISLNEIEELLDEPDEYKKICHFFGNGEFPVVWIYFIMQEDKNLYICYTLVR